MSGRGARGAWTMAFGAALLGQGPAPVDPVPGALPEAREVVRRADDLRNPTLSYIAEVRITTTATEGREGTSLYRVFIKGRSRSFVEFLEPAQYKGMALLMSGEDSWLYLPSIGRATRVSSYQGLTGNVANGDIARLNFLEDYDAMGVAAESLDGREVYRVELMARRPSATYRRVALWVEPGTFRPLRAEFFTVSGRLLKTGEYGDYREVLGAIRPTRLTIQDATRGGGRSIMEFRNFEKKDLPDRMFTRTYISRPR